MPAGALLATQMILLRCTKRDVPNVLFGRGPKIVSRRSGGGGGCDLAQCHALRFERFHSMPQMKDQPSVGHQTSEPQEDRSNDNQPTDKTANSAPTTLIDVSESHLHCHRMYRSTSHQVVRGLHGNTQTNCYCKMRALRQAGNGPSPMRSGPQGKLELCVQRAD